MDVMQDIPKLYTAVSEWAACLGFIFLLKRRWSAQLTALISAASLILLCVIQYFIGIVPVGLWIPGMIVALAVMYGTLYLCCDIPMNGIGFYWAIAFIFAEFVASLDWQFYTFFAHVVIDGVWVQIIFFIIFYGGTFFVLYLEERRLLAETQNLRITAKEFASSTVISVGAFLISNISYVSTNTPLSGRMSMEIFYIRTLVDLAGVIMLLAYQERLAEMQTRVGLEAINSLLQRQYEQYRISKENMEAINRKYHDLKHQIGIIRLEADPQKREEYLNQLESGVQSIGAAPKTGNDVLDTILFSKQIYCSQHDIVMTIVADGAQLEHMDVMDICSIFGNALDNAIENVEKIADTQKRLIQVAVFTQNDFLMIRVKNYFENNLQMEDGEFKTTKKDKNYHGYGIKSMHYVAEKYGGTVSIQARDHWFWLQVLIPL